MSRLSHGREISITKRLQPRSEGIFGVLGSCIRVLGRRTFVIDRGQTRVSAKTLAQSDYYVVCKALECVVQKVDCFIVGNPELRLSLEEVFA